MVEACCRAWNGRDRNEGVLVVGGPEEGTCVGKVGGGVTGRWSTRESLAGRRPSQPSHAKTSSNTRYRTTPAVRFIQAEREQQFLRCYSRVFV